MTLQARWDPSAKFTDRQCVDDTAISPPFGIRMQTGHVLSMPGETTASACWEFHIIMRQL